MYYAFPSQAMGNSLLLSVSIESCQEFSNFYINV